MENILYIFGGLPGTGKSTLASHLARVTRAVYLRIDTIEEALLKTSEVIGPEGYEVAYGIAKDNLRCGLSVVADSVNPIELTRAAWRDVATNLGLRFRQIEVGCSNSLEHRRRIECRQAENPVIRSLTWQDVINREYEVWETPDIFIDTAQATAEENCAELENLLRMQLR